MHHRPVGQVIFCQLVRQEPSIVDTLMGSYRYRYVGFSVVILQAFNGRSLETVIDSYNLVGT